MYFLSGAVPIMNPIVDLDHWRVGNSFPEWALVFSVARGTARFKEWPAMKFLSGAVPVMSPVARALVFSVSGDSVRVAKEGAAGQVPRARPSESKGETLTRLIQTGESSFFDFKKND